MFSLKHASDCLRFCFYLIYIECFTLTVITWMMRFNNLFKAPLAANNVQLVCMRNSCNRFAVVTIRGSNFRENAFLPYSTLKVAISNTSIQFESFRWSKRREKHSGGHINSEIYVDDKWLRVLIKIVELSILVYFSFSIFSIGLITQC